MTRHFPRDERPRIRHNDYTALQPPTLGEWTPSSLVSVVIPVFENQAKVDLVLSALAAQSYPDDLLEVVVVDDGSREPIRLPERVPSQTYIVRSFGNEWGSAHAFHTGVRAARGEVIVRIDSDVVPRSEHVEAHMRWHHVADYLVVLGTVVMVDFQEDAFSCDEVYSATLAGYSYKLFEKGETRASWVESVIDQTERLLKAGNRAYRVADGANVSFNRELYLRAGGIDPRLRLGSDTELAYRLAQSGAVFVPEAASRAWHLGIPQMETRKDEGRRYRLAHLSHRVPVERSWRRSPGRTWQVPYVDAVVEVGGHSYESVGSTVDGILASSLQDVHVGMIASWSSVSPPDRRLLDAPDVALRLLAASYEPDRRVSLLENAPQDSFPAPFRFVCPVGLVPDADTLERLVALADQHRFGLLHVACSTGLDLVIARLERTEAFRRAAHLASSGDDISDVVGEIYGSYWLDGQEWGLSVELDAGTGTSFHQLRAQLARWQRAAKRLESELVRMRDAIDGNGDKPETRPSSMERIYKLLGGRRSKD